jgi:hypothetical protein
MNRFLYALIVAGITAQAQTPDSLQTKLPRPLSADKRPLFDVYAIAPRDLSGGGFGMGGFSPAVPLGSLIQNAELRFGGDFYFMGLDRRWISNVPLLSPQTGEAKVKLNESMLGLNLVARLSTPWKAALGAYIDGFAGLRYVSTGMEVTPNQPQINHDKTTSTDIDGSYALQYGVAGGVLVKLTNQLKLNAALVYSHSDRPGSVSNIHSASIDGGSVMMDKKILPRDMVLLKLGVSFLINPSNNNNGRCNCCCRRNHFNAGTVRPVSGRMPNRIGTGFRVAK